MSNITEAVTGCLVMLKSLAQQLHMHTLQLAKHAQLVWQAVAAVCSNLVWQLAANSSRFQVQQGSQEEQQQQRTWSSKSGSLLTGRKSEGCHTLAPVRSSGSTCSFMMHAVGSSVRSMFCGLNCVTSNSCSCGAACCANQQQTGPTCVSRYGPSVLTRSKRSCVMLCSTWLFMMMGLWLGALVAGRSGAAIALHRTTLLRVKHGALAPAIRSPL